MSKEDIPAYFRKKYIRRAGRLGNTIICLIFSVISVILFGNCRQSPRPESRTQTREYIYQSANANAVTQTEIPTVPDYIVFADDTIRFDSEDLYERMDRELLAFTFSHTTSILMLKRAPKYFPQIEPILKKHGIPDDFKYLMVIESNLDPQSVSTVGAAGLWQFTKTTGKQYGLEINANIDERYNIEKATTAACEYLNNAYNKYHNWLTVAASYNAGQNRITNEITRQRQKNAMNLWLPKETSRYIFRILAAKMMFSNPEQFGFDLREDQLYKPISCSDTVIVRNSIADLAAFALRHGVTYLELRKANLWLLEQNLKNQSKREYRIAIPDNEKKRSRN